MTIRPKPDKPAAGQESVWDYPRPPRLETFVGSINVELGGKTIASTIPAWRVLFAALGSERPSYLQPGCDVYVVPAVQRRPRGVLTWSQAAYVSAKPCRFVVFTHAYDSAARRSISAASPRSRAARLRVSPAPSSS